MHSDSVFTMNLICCAILEYVKFMNNGEINKSNEIKYNNYLYKKNCLLEMPGFGRIETVMLVK